MKLRVLRVAVTEFRSPQGIAGKWICDITAVQKNK